MGPETRQHCLVPLLLLALAAPGFAQKPRPHPGGQQKKQQQPAHPKTEGKTPGPKNDRPGQPDPSQEADLVTAQADRAAVRDVERQKMLREHFKLCDLDGSGWISFREAESTLGIDRDEYRRYDANQDGRVAPGEFELRSQELLTLLGALEPRRPRSPEPFVPSTPSPAAPSPAPIPVSPPGRRAFADLYPRPGDLITRYDVNKSRGLDRHELEALFTEVGLMLSSELVVAQMDPNDSGELEASELVGIAFLVSEHLPETGGLGRPTSTGPEAQESAGGDDGVPLAPSPRRSRAGDALTHFQRLDPGNDGWIDEDDLRALLASSRLDVRLSAVLSALDRDGDGRLDRTEFLDALGDGAAR